MHECPSLGGLTVPFSVVSDPDDMPDSRHLVVEREDYIGESGSSPTMAVQTDRADGSYDRTVFAPTARLDLGSANPGASVGAGVGVAEVAGHVFHDEMLERLAEYGEGLDMAWTASAVFACAVLDMVNNVASHSPTLSTDAFKCALYNNTPTPDRTVAVASSYYNAAQWVTANEQYQAGQWAQAGVALASVTSTQTSNVVTFDAANTASGSACTLANVYGCLVYETTIATFDGICFNYFGGSNSVTAGTFTVVWNALGIATFTT